MLFFCFIAGKLHLPSLAKICECVRSVGFSNGFAYFPERHRKTGIVLFIVSQTFTFTKDAHFLRKSNNFGLNKPHKFLMHLTQAGKTSYTTHIDWFDSEQRKIASFLTKHVSADVRTRRPVPHPEYFYKNLMSHLSSVNKQTIERVDLPEIPNEAFCINVKVLYSDCDDNIHVNQSSYLKWCSDVASEAAIKEHFSNFKTHIELYPLNTMEIFYSGEGFVSDELEVKAWECDADSTCLMFAIQKKGTIIFHMKMKFFDQHLDGKLSRLAARM